MHAAYAHAARPTAAAKAQAWASAVEDVALSPAARQAVISGFTQADQRDLLAPYTERYFAALDGVWRSRGAETARQIVTGLYPVLQADRETMAATDAWLAAHDAPPALRRLLSEGRARTEQTLRVRAADAAAAAAGATTGGTDTRPRPPLTGRRAPIVHAATARTRGADSPLPGARARAGSRLRVRAYACWSRLPVWRGRFRLRGLAGWCGRGRCRAGGRRSPRR
ncbi:ERAP1-like C-terminal domain-containing protein [Streptomyces bambusae]|uniref:ERAP1-like C-terminal domain-containing protein n=1 Tax=Streptomyces bambusae TaxID=1550616 RepID=UPI001CFE5AAB|nr:ERAP1-like C-terminal domain-containing protein [Streptomyces bambusae]MCB5167411.1 ERAP1-like C-terminal domain-containing protein [Streptomyces bambusae]